MIKSINRFLPVLKQVNSSWFWKGQFFIGKPVN